MLPPDPWDALTSEWDSLCPLLRRALAAGVAVEMVYDGEPGGQQLCWYVTEGQIQSALVPNQTFRMQDFPWVPRECVSLQALDTRRDQVQFLTRS